MKKYRFLLWIFVVILALINIAYRDWIFINFPEVDISSNIEQKNGFIIVSLSCGMILRIVTLNKILFPLLIIADLVLIYFAIFESGLIADTFIQTLANFASRSIYLFIFISILVLIFDWRMRYKKIQTIQI